MIRRLPPAPYNDKHNVEKQNARLAIVNAAQKLGIIPKTIFTLPAMYAFCVKLFRETWGNDVRIIAIERDFRSAFMTQAHLYKCEVYKTSFEYYARKHQNSEGETVPIIRMGQENTRGKKLWNFTYPTFDLAYVDLCTTPKNIEIIMTFMNDHLAKNSMIAVTLKAKTLSEAHERTDNLLSLGDNKYEKIEVIQYDTGGKNHMMLAIIRRIV